MAIVDYTDALDAGWRIFPLHSFKFTPNGPVCACGREDCEAVGKHPKASNWQYTQPYTETQLAYLEDEAGIFGGNQLIDHYGIVLSTSGLLVVDIDGRNGGFESAEKLQAIREKCGFIVESGSGFGEHWYFKNTADFELLTNNADYKGIDFKSSGFVVGCGSLHKSGQNYCCIKGSPAQITDAPAELLEIIKRPVRQTFSVEGSNVTVQELAEMIKYIKHDEGQTYDRWLAVGMALHHATNGADEGEELWYQWTVAQGRNDTETISQKWHSFGKSSQPVTQGTLMTWAKEGGYSQPVTFKDDTEWDELPQPAKKQTKEIELPKNSLVHACYEFIDGNCMFPRQKIALAAALQTVGNVAGLRYLSGITNASINLMTFAIADSGTGKEAIYQSMLDIMRAAGVSRATHGGIKSEQEIIRNMIRNQASFYIIDEYGTELQKIANAGSGGAHYLMAVPARIMSVYTKAVGFYPVSGDIAEEQRERLERQLSSKYKQQDDGKNVDKEIESLQKQIKSVDVGIEDPFLSFFGITEPFSFDSAINKNHELLVNGFMSRALIFREEEGAPRFRKDFTGKKEVPFKLAARLFNLYANGESVDLGEEVRRRGDRTTIPMTPEAERELDIISNYWQAENEYLAAEGQGLQSISNRAREMVIKIAGIVSIPLDSNEPMIIDVEHMRYAQSLIQKLVSYKLTHVKMLLSSDRQTDKEERGEALLENISRLLNENPDGLGFGVLRNRLRLFSRENIEQGLDRLISKGEIQMLEYLDCRNRKQKKYKKI